MALKSGFRLGAAEEVVDVDELEASLTASGVGGGESVDVVPLLMTIGGPVTVPKTRAGV